MLRRWIPHGALALALAALCGAGALEPLERLLADARFRLTDRAPTAGVVVVGIDPRSLEAIDVWPWDRGLHATVLENLLDAGATRVGFDIDFSSRSLDPEQDAQLAGAFETAGPDRVVLPTFRQRGGEGAGPLQTRPLPAFRQHASLASINIRPDSDGMVRRYVGVGEFDGKPVPSFAAALSGLPVGPGRPFVLDYGIRLDEIPHLSYLDVLTGNFERSAVSGRAVIVGATAVELGDRVTVPRWSSVPGPLLQALAFETLTQNRALARPARWLAALLAAAFGVGCLMLLQRSTWRGGLVWAAAGGSLVFALAWAAQRSWPVTIDTAPPLIALVGACAVALVLRVDQQQISLVLQSLRLQRTESLMQHVVDNSFDAILTLDGAGRVESFNRAARELFVASGDALIGKPIDALVPAWGSDPGLVDGRPRESRGRKLTGAAFPLELSVVAVQGDEEGRRVCFLRDITERKTQEYALTHQATHDALTGLPNRVLLRDRIEQALRDAERNGVPTAFMILDLDRFKEVNDTLGHHVGDLLLQQIGKRLLGPLRRSDTIARLGGDEFAVLLPGADLDDAREVAGRLSQTLVEPFKLYGLSLSIEASVGIAMYPENGTGATELIQRADVAMYVAKRSRSELSVYHPDQDFTSLRHLTLNGELRQAIEENELQLYYQPKLACANGELVGVEALVRWEHPQHGVLPPSEFIGVAEHTGLIKPLSHWVLRRAIRQCAEWREQGLGLAVSVNLSPRNLQEEGLPARLEKMLQDAELPPKLLTLEITESVLMDNPSRSVEVLSAFADLGVGISIDDYGTGYSSLAYLKRLPAREIKIDRAFVSEIDRDKEDAVIVRSTIDMAHNLGLSVVAEGVESDAVWQQLRELGCDSAQGYLFSPPVPADSLLSWIEDPERKNASVA